MSHDGASENAAAAAPLTNEVWREIRVKAQPDSWLPPYPLHNTNYYFKFIHDAPTASFCLIVTDLCFVWLRRVDAKTIDADMKKYNPSIRKKATNATISMLSELLHKNTSQQFHLVRLELPEGAEEEARAAAEEVSTRANKRSGSFAHMPVAAPVLTPSLQLESTMSLGGLITFRWKFHLHPYGGPLDQCAFLRQQMYLPLHEMIKLLSYQVAAEKQKNEKLMASLHNGSHSSAAAAAHPHHAPAAAAARGQDVSLSFDLPSLSTAEREAQAQRAAAGGDGVTGPLSNYDHFAQEFSFAGQVGQLYVSALHRLIGEDASFPGASTQPSFDPFQVSQADPSMDYELADGGAGAAAATSSSRDRKPTAAGRRGLKRDRSPSPAPSTTTAAAAARPAIDRAYERDPDLDYKHNYDDGGFSPSLGLPSASADAYAASASLLHGVGSSMQSSLDIGGTVDEETGAYRESEAEKARRELLARQLEAAKKKKKKKAFV